MTLAQIKTSFLSTLMTAVSGVTAIAAWQEQLDWGLRIVASLIAIIAGTLAIRDWIKRHKRK